MASNFVYPSNAELQAIAQEKTALLTMDRAGFKLFPMRDIDSAILMWEQMDNYLGLQQIRGLNAEPPRVVNVGGKRYTSIPGVYGEFMRIDELELTERRQWGTFGQAIDVRDLTMVKQDNLLSRRLDRIEAMIWTLVTTGTFSVTDAAGNVQHTDTYPIQTQNAAVSWGTFATAKPLNDFRLLKLKQRGKGVEFNAKATAYLSQVTFNNLVQNTNANDLGGKRLAGLQAPIGLSDINTVLLGEDMPQLQIYDLGYLNDSGTFVPFLADNTVTVVGVRRPGQVIGEFLFTRNAQNPGLAAGPYMRIIDRSETHIPGTIEVHDGWNGGPVIYFPGSVVKMAV